MIVGHFYGPCFVCFYDSRASRAFRASVPSCSSVIISILSHNNPFGIKFNSHVLVLFIFLQKNVFIVMTSKSEH